MKIEVYILPTFWASALINADYSGLSDEEKAALDAWLTTYFPNGAHCIDFDGDSMFSDYHDARNYVLPCDCGEYTFDVSNA